MLRVLCLDSLQISLEGFASLKTESNNQYFPERYRGIDVYRYSVIRSSSSAYQLANFCLLSTISQHRFAHAHRVSFISAEDFQFVRCWTGASAFRLSLERR